MKVHIFLMIKQSLGDDYEQENKILKMRKYYLIRISLIIK
jgi:hypothetical protein